MNRRRSDRGWHRLVRENAYRDVWLFAVTLIVLFAISQSGDAVDKVQQGRRIGSAISCAVLSGIGEAGREVIAAGANQPETPFLRFLEQHGYPPPSVRKAQAKVAARAYVAGITHRVDAAIGRKGDSLVNRDGTVNCAQLARITAIPHGLSPH